GRHTRFSRDWSSDVCSSDLSRSSSAELFSLTRCLPRYGFWRLTTLEVRTSSATVWTPSPTTAAGSLLTTDSARCLVARTRWSRPDRKRVVEGKRRRLGARGV